MTDPKPPGPAGTAPFRRHAAELDLFAGQATMPAARLVGILAIAAGLAALVNAEALSVWAIDLPLWLGPVRTGIVAATQAWADATAAAGLHTPYDAARDLFRQFQDWRPGE